MQEREHFLYKFIKAEHAELCIANGSIVATELGFSNDPLENSPAFESSNIPQQKEEWRKIQEKLLPRVVCLTSRISVSAMWGHYADQHKGVVLAYNLKKIQELAQDRGLYIYKCVYKNERIPISQEELNLLQKNEDDKIIDIQEQLKGKLLNLRAQKSKDWEYEQEIRLDVSDSKDVHPENRQWIFTNLKPCLSGVILGKNCSLREPYIRKLLEHHGYTPDIQVERARESMTHLVIETGIFGDMPAEKYNELDISNINTNTITPKPRIPLISFD